MKHTPTLLSFNRGLMDPLALARIDLKRTALAAELQTNWMPRALGPMMLRPGLEYMSATRNNGAAVLIPFVFAADDTAIIEATADGVRVLVGEPPAPITYPTVSTLPLADFPLWTDASDPGATWDTAPVGAVRLTGTGTGRARGYTAVSVGGADAGVEHVLKGWVTKGKIRVRIGTTPGGVEYEDIVMSEGMYYAAFTPAAGTFYVDLSSYEEYESELRAYLTGFWTGGLVSGELLLDQVAWGASALPKVRYAQSGDVVFCSGNPDSSSRAWLRRIARYGPRSWAIEAYQPESGPFDPPNTSNVTLAASALTGSVTLTASDPIFTTRHMDSLVKLTSAGQFVNVNVTAEDQWSNTIRITGVGDARAWAFALRGTWTATVTLQRAIGEPSNWLPVATYTTNQETPFNDGLDNITVYYRIGVAVGDFTSGTVDADLASTSGSITGIARISSTLTSVPSATCSAAVLQTFGGTAATKDWAFGSWSVGKGYPTSVAFYDGRLWWAGRDEIWGSISDDFEGFDEDFEGDAGPIKRSLGSGPVDDINWLLPLSQLMVGTPSQELSARSNSFDEPLTPTAFRLLTSSTQGSAAVQAVRVDTTGVYVQRNGARVYELIYDGGDMRYMSKDLTAVVPDIGRPGIIRMGVQRQPDTRIHCVRSDGKVAILVFDSVEEVNCWVLFETDGFVEEVAVLPGVSEDQVYYVVRRTVGGLPKRYIERWTTEEESRGGTVTKLMDSSKTYTGLGSDTLTGLEHLEGLTVCVWADGKDLGTYVVSGGAVTLPGAVDSATVGLPYTAQFKSAKLALTLKDGRTSLTQRQRLDHVGLVLAYTHAQGLRYGQSFDQLDDLPLIEQGDVVDPNKVWDAYEEDTVELNGTWEIDARLCLEAASPRPCTVLAAVVPTNTNFKD